MNTQELNCILERALCGTNCHFLGVFAADQVPQHIDKYPCCFVANTDPARMPGAHWVACYFTSPRRAEFFDSYGLPPSYYVHLRLPVTSPSYNRCCFQSLYSSACGHYCVYFLCNRAFKRSMHALQLDLKRASRVVGHPDSFVRYFLTDVVRKLHIVRRCLRECRGMQCCVSRNRFRTQ